MALEVGESLTVYDIKEDDGTILLSADDGSIYTLDCEESPPPLQPPGLPTVPASLICPACGNDRMLYVEDIGCAREVNQFDDDGTLLINGLYTTNGYDDGTNPRIQCSSCCREFAVPDEVDFI